MAGWEAVNYSRDDIMRMQQDAERRVREMQRKAQQAVLRGVVPPPPEAQPINMNVPEPEVQTEVKKELHIEPEKPITENTFNNQNTPRQNPQRNIHQHQQQQNFNPPRQRPTTPMQPLGSPIKNISNMISGLLGKDSGGVQNILSGFIKENREDTPIGKVMSALNLDSEKLILIFLILVLLNDGADYSLILALGYILL